MNEDNNIQNLFRRMKSERLSADEKTEVRNRLLMRARGLTPTYRELSRHHFSFYFSKISRQVVYMSAVAVVVVGGAGVSFAAEGSLPGDILYSVKVKVTEPLRTALALGAAQANWQATLAERRLGESTKLSAMGKLDTVVQNQLLLSAADHVQAYENELAQSGSDADESQQLVVASRLESSLEAHAGLVSSLPTSTIPAVEKIRKSAGDMAAVRARVETSLGTQPAQALKTVSDKQQKLAEKEYAQAHALLETRKQDLPPATAESAALELDSASSTIEAAKQGAESGSYQNAISQFLEASRAAHGANIILRATPSQRDSENLGEGHSSGQSSRDGNPLPDTQSGEGD